MFKLLAAVVASAALASAQDMAAVITSASDTDLLAYMTITTACLPAVDPNNEPIFSIQTDTMVESCTYVVNADNTAQVVSTIGATATSTLGVTSSTSLPLSTIVGTNNGSTSGLSITTATTISTESSASSEASATTSESSSTPETTAVETTGAGAEESSATSEPAASPTDGGASRIATCGIALGVAGLMAVLTAL